MFKKLLPLFLLILSVSSLHAQTVGYALGPFGITELNLTAGTLGPFIPIQIPFPIQIIASPDGSRVYALFTSGNDITSGSILVLDTATNTVVTTIPNVGAAPFGLAITPDGAHIYVADEGNAVVIVDTATNTVEPNPISLGGIPSTLIVTPDGTRVYVVQTLSESVSVISTATNTVVGSPIPIGCIALGKMATTPDGTQVYVPCASPGEVVAISTATNTVSATIPFDSFDFSLAITPDGAQVYVSGLLSGAVGVISTATNTLTATIPVGSQPTGIAITPDGALVFVTLRNSSTATLIFTGTNTIVQAGIPVTPFPQEFVLLNVNAPFASFPAPTPGSPANPNKINLSGSLSLGANSQGLDFAHQPMTLTVGGFSLLFPAGTVTQVGNSSRQHFTFSGTLNGLSVTFDLIGNSPNFTYSFIIQGKNVGTQVGPNPVTVTLAIGSNSGSSTVNF